MSRAPCLFISSLVIMSLALSTNGCVSNRAYRSGAAAVQNRVPVADPGNGVQSADFKLGFVEFDDMGESWEPCPSLAEGTECQRSRVLAVIRNEKGTPCSGGRCLHDVVVVVFVHGWKNNASPYNETHKNLLAFNKLLAQLASGEKLTANAQARPPRTYMASTGHGEDKCLPEKFSLPSGIAATLPPGSQARHFPKPFIELFRQRNRTARIAKWSLSATRSGREFWRMRSATHL